jgi:hypothetical protein
VKETGKGEKSDMTKKKASKDNKQDKSDELDEVLNLT